MHACMFVCKQDGEEAAYPKFSKRTNRYHMEVMKEERKYSYFPYMAARMLLARKEFQWSFLRPLVVDNLNPKQIVPTLGMKGPPPKEELRKVSSRFLMKPLWSVTAMQFSIELYNCIRANKTQYLPRMKTVWTLDLYVIMTKWWIASSYCMPHGLSWWMKLRNQNNFQAMATKKLFQTRTDEEINQLIWHESSKSTNKAT